MTTTIDCPGCDGHGVRGVGGWLGTYPCRTCNGAARVVVDVDAIRRAIVTRSGSLRRSMSSTDQSLPFGAFYVWRMARFNGGADLHMPMSAYDAIGCFGLVKDCHKAAQALLDPIADDVARTHFGSDLRAARAWGSVLGMI